MSYNFSLSVLIRRLRPLLSTVGIVIWILFRLSRTIITWIMMMMTTTRSSSLSSSASDYDYEEEDDDPLTMIKTPFFQSWRKNDPSLLQLIIDIIHQFKAHIAGRLWALDSYLSSSSSSSLLVGLPPKSISYYILVPIWQWMIQFIEDGLGILLLGSILRIIYCIYHFTYVEWKDSIIDSIFEWSKKHISHVSKTLDNEMNKLQPDMERSMNKNPNRSIIRQLPPTGQSSKTILRHLKSSSDVEHETWKSGKVSGTVYQGSIQHAKLMNDTYALYSVANTLHAGMWPKLNQCEAEVVSMTGQLLHLPISVSDDNDDTTTTTTTPIISGCTTSGGTESILLAIRAHLQYYGKSRGIYYPELICGSTAHAAVDKACEIYGIRKVCIDCSSSSSSSSSSSNDTWDYTLSPQKVRQSITSNTIMIYASAPNFPQGTIDPIEELGRIAQQYDIGLHVDACLGGFVLPFLTHMMKKKKKNIMDNNNNDNNNNEQEEEEEEEEDQPAFPKFDFQVPGVTSMSADTHKFGYAAKGTSVVLYRDNDLRHAQYFCYANWTGGMYGTPTLAGSRPSGLIACAWASLISLGQEGFQQRAKQIVTASLEICHGIANDIDELYTLNGSQTPSMVVCFSTTSTSKMSIYRIGDAMKSRGWHLNNLQHPASISLCVTLNVAPLAKTFLHDLKESVIEIQQEDPENSNKGMAGVYGMTCSLPDGPINHMLRVFMDLFLVP